VTAPTQHALNLVGCTVVWDGKQVECIGVERTGSVIVDGETGEEWPGVRFLMKTRDGKQKWTTAFPDKGAA